MQQISVLLIDDDKELSGLVAEYLEAKGMKVLTVNYPGDAMDLLEVTTVDICVLDVMMPGINGFELAVELQKRFQELPFIFLSGQGQKEERIKGLQLGAEDYIVKPFSLEELHLRLMKIMSRFRKPNLSEDIKSDTLFHLGRIAFDPDYQQLSIVEYIIRLTSIENKLLKLLCDHMNEMVSREFLMKSIWGDDDEYKSRSLNVYITRLRKYLEHEPNVEIVNQHGEGYKLVARQG